jgi:hypothetical protein
MILNTRTIKTFATKTLLAFFVLIFITPQMALAQISGGGSGNLSGSLNVQGLGGVLLSCTGLDNKITGALGDLTSSLSNNNKSNNNPSKIGNGSGTDSPVNKDGKTSSQADANSVPVAADSTTQRVGDVNEKQAEVRKAEEDDNKAKQCLKDVAYYGAKQLLQKFTTQTVAWIQGGFKGQPLYVRDTASFFQSIANEEWTKLTTTIAFDTQNYPFGRDTAISLLRSATSTFEQNAQFTLRRAVPTGNETDFYRDIRIGGWNAFLTQTLLPQNNPVGFYAMAQQEIDRKTEGGDINNIQSVQQELAQSGGFLSQKVCALSYHESGEYIDPLTGDQTFDDYPSTGDSTTGGPIPIDSSNGFSDGGEAIKDQNYWTSIMNNSTHTQEQREYAQKRVCKTYETTTPGQSIANILTATTTSSVRQAELIDDVNESLSAIFDAALAWVAGEGLKALEGDTDENGTTITGGGPGQNVVGGSLQDILDGLTDEDEGINGFNGDEALYENLPYIIYLHKRYAGIDVSLPPAPQYEDENGNMVDAEGYEDPTPGYYGLPTNNDRLYDVVMSLQNLDYCLPGPHYGWEEDLDASWDAYFQKLMSSGTFSLDDETSSISTFLDPLGLISGSVENMVAKGEQAYMLAYQEMYRKYKEEIIKARWPDDLNVPSVRKDANKELRRLDMYIEQIDINKVAIEETKRLIIRLETLKEKVDAVTTDINGTNAQIALLTNSELNGPTHQALLSDLAEHQAELEKHKRTFYRMAPDLVGKSDILDAEDEMQGYVDLREYTDELLATCWDETSDPAEYNFDGSATYWGNRRDTYTINGTLLTQQWNNSFEIYSPVDSPWDFSDLDFGGDFLADWFSSVIEDQMPSAQTLEQKLGIY